MKKTVLETQFEKVIINHICSLDVSPHSRAKILIDFHENASEYYDNLCDILYAASTHAVQEPIWMTNSGMFYASEQLKNTDDLFVAAANEIPNFEGDIVAQLELIFLCIYRVSSRNFKKM